MKIDVSITNPMMCRRMNNDPCFQDEELYRAAANGHKYAVGETCKLAGLVSYPEYNGETVEITSIREDGPHGKAYYIRGEINRCINWIYESRLSPC